MKDGAQQGITDRNRKAEILILEQEELLWASGLGSSTPRKLVDTMLYLIGLHFALRAGQEHRYLRWENSQLTVMTDLTGMRYLRYTEDVSKNNSGGLKHRKNKNKVVHAYEDRRERCIVTLFQLYDEHCPETRNAFYLGPLEKPTYEGNIWFLTQPIGLHTLTSTMSRLCRAAGIPGFHTNHSFRATAATRLYEEDVDEQLISEITGHRSSAVREYKRRNDDQRRKGNAIVAGRKETLELSPAKCPRLDDSFDARIPHVTINVNLNK